MFDISFMLGFIWDGISNFSLGSVSPTYFWNLKKKNKKKHFLSVMELPFIPFLLECDILDSTIMPQRLGENIALARVDADETYSIMREN